MQNSVLFRRSSFFVDAFNIIFYTDLFLYHELSKRMEYNGFLEKIFKEKLPRFNADSRGKLDKLIIKSTANKLNQNILLDWISEYEFNRFDVDMTINDYVATLYLDMLSNPICDEYMQITEFGNALKLISSDRQLNHMSIYVPFNSDFINQSISDYLSGTTGNDFKIVAGGKVEYLKTNKFDSYVFENVSDIDEILATDESRNSLGGQFIKEILIPTYEFNMEEGRTNLDILIEQVTYHKLKLNKSPNEYTNDFNLSINTISVPI